MSSASDFDSQYTLDHKYTRESGQIYISGVQALVRLPLMQQIRDSANVRVSTQMILAVVGVVDEKAGEKVLPVYQISLVNHLCIRFILLACRFWTKSS